jgi:hypothetical protein
MVFIIYNGIIMLPIGLPVLSVRNMISYFEFGSKYMGTGEALRWEDGKRYELPQDYADMLGWESMVGQISEVYHQLPANERAKCSIFAANYGEAGAIDYYGEKYHLPKSISKGSSYWLWGYREYDGQLAIITGLTVESVKSLYNEILAITEFRYPHARESGMSIIVARNPKMSMIEMWQVLKKHRY